MGAAPIFNTRQVIVEDLQAFTALTDEVPADRIFGEKTERGAWPFIRCSDFEGTPRFEIIGNVHTFTRGAFSDDAHRINEIVGNRLDSLVLTLDDGRRVNIEVTQTRLLEDPDEKDGWHAICSILATIAADCDDN